MNKTPVCIKGLLNYIKNSHRSLYFSILFHLFQIQLEFRLKNVEHWGMDHFSTLCLWIKIFVRQKNPITSEFYFFILNTIPNVIMSPEIDKQKCNYRLDPPFEVILTKFVFVALRKCGVLLPYRFHNMSIYCHQLEGVNRVNR